MTYEQIRYTVRDDVALITLNRPERRNALTRQMAREATDAIERANVDRAVGAIVMTGEGKGFCAGADMEDFFQAPAGGEDSPPDTDRVQREMAGGQSWVDLVRRSKPIIAAVNGAAVGAGLTLILPFDIIVASERARFGMFFIKMGVVPELAGTHFLVQRMGFGRASEMCLSGRLYAAEEAYAAGLVEHVFPHDQHLVQALEIARGIAENPPPQLRMIKQLLEKNGSETDLALVQRREEAIVRECLKTPEHREAVSAFVERRKPKFR